jgi:hypothetical protein
MVIMDNELSPDVQELVRVCKGIIRSAYYPDGRSEKDCEAVLFYALQLITAIEPHCEKNHQHSTLEKGLPYLVPDSQLLHHADSCINPTSSIRRSNNS